MYYDVIYLRHSLFQSILHHKYMYNGWLYVYIDRLHKDCLSTHQYLQEKNIIL